MSYDDTAHRVDDGDTSFEIDEPEDEEIIEPSILIDVNNTRPADSASTITLTAETEDFENRNICPTIVNNNSESYVTCHNSINHDTKAIEYKHSGHKVIPQVSINDDDLGCGTDSSMDDDSQTCSSTPTTADVADISSTGASPYKLKQLVPYASYPRKLIAQNTQIINMNRTIAEDNLSVSIATNETATTTTVTEIENELCIQNHPIQINQALLSTFYSEGLINENPSSSKHEHKRTLSSSSNLSNKSRPAMGHGIPIETEIPNRLIAFYSWLRWMHLVFKNSGIGEPSVYHALVVIFLEFFAWGLLTMPVISVLNQTFPDHTFLMNGLVMGIKGILSFLSAPLIGALSDIWGRKFFLLITVFFTCAPIPLMTINTWWFFAMISISGVFAVTFSVVFAYVADVTTVEERSRAYGLVSATFAASLVISPALGAALMEMYGDTLVVALATAIAVLDVFFILVAVPESLPEKMRPSSWGAPISWEQADPFAALRKVGTDHTILMQCITVLLSYLPEAGQYSCIFVYLKLKMGFNSMEVAIFIAVVGILSISIQVTLGHLMRALGGKHTIIIGLVLEMFQLLWYGFGSEKWMMWAAGILAALASITYPAISAFVSIHSNADRQGAVQGMVTGMRGLCNGLGPAMFGLVFYLFNVDLNDGDSAGNQNVQSETKRINQMVPGPPFAFGAFMVILAILVAIFIPANPHIDTSLTRAPSEKKRVSVDVQYEIDHGHKSGPLSPLMRSDSLAQL